MIDILKYLLVTPDMHRIHHSIIKKEYNSNFGFHLSCWDRVFHTYTDKPKKPQTTMKLGILGYENFDEMTLWQLLKMPFDHIYSKYI